MKDFFGRTIDYLRLSVTDRCNLRCVYCMPEQGVTWMPHADILSFEEILRLIRVMAQLGIAKIKVTGGEALTRRGLTGLITELKQADGIQQVTLTTNGILLMEHLDNLIAAGLDALNISLDTLNSETYNRITRSGGFEQLESLIRQIRSLPFPVKINCVPIRGLNDSEITAIAGLAKDYAAAVRFIELMPLGQGSDYELLTQEETAAEIKKVYGPLAPFPEKLGNGPAVYYSLSGFKGKIGFISPMSHNFCDTCSRLRLSAAGLLMPCLACTAGLDLRNMLRGNAGFQSKVRSYKGKNVTDEELSMAIQNLVNQKPRCHSFAAKEQAAREMFRIGG